MDAFADFETPAQRNCTFGQMAAGHVGYFRDTLSWAAVETSPHTYDFSRYDADYYLILLKSKILLQTPSTSNSENVSHI